MADTLVTVPFTFNVAGRDCPAGLYSVHRDLSSGLVILRSMDRSRTFSWFAGSGEPGPTIAESFCASTTWAKQTLQSIQYQTIITSRLDKAKKESEYVAPRTMAGQ
jgi:hypothetical protein